MYHKSLNNFRSYYNGYPFGSNSIKEDLFVCDDSILVDAAIEQIDSIMTLKPFDPEDFGFKPHKNSVEFLEEWVILNDNVDCFIKRDASMSKDYWLFAFKVRRTHLGEDPFEELITNVCHMFIPNDMAGRIILTGLGIIKRRDIDDDKVSCVNDKDFDGICSLCEDMGCCMEDITIINKETIDAECVNIR
jgi:hypothetical protein